MADLELKVTEICDLIPEIKSFEFVSADGKDLPAFTAGSHIDVHTGNDLWRSYSLANNPTERHQYVTGILYEPQGGGGSKWMHDELSVGDIIKARGPLNKFPLDESAKSHLLIAGGIGITPLMAMGYRLRDSSAEFHLHYCTKSPEQTAFIDEVKKVFGDKLSFHHDGGDPSKGIKLTEVLQKQPDGGHVYICGPGGLLNAARNAASHWSSGTVHFEVFSSTKSGDKKPIDDEQVNEEFEVEISSSGQVLTIPSDKSILEVLLDNDLECIYVCEEGWCGTCEVGLISGKADHRDEVLSDDEKEANTKIQVCISRAIPGERLVLDL